MKKLLFGLLLFLSAPSCFAECASLGEAIAEKLHPGLASFQACKAMPDDESKTIVVLSFECTTEPVEGSNCRDVEILVVAADGETIASRLFQKNAWWDDAFQFQDVWVDTARYQLSPQDRAFGIRINRDNAKYGGSVQDLSLYVIHGKEISLVLDYLEASANIEGAEPDPNCGFSGITMNRSLAIANTMSHGYADLRLDETTVSTKNEFVKGRCNESNIKKRKRFLLHFDGKQYVVPTEVLNSGY